MMYQTGLVAVIKVNGQVLRENKDVVLLPFGSEYSILIKNLKAQRVMTCVSVDGQDVLDGEKLVINANSELELERSIKNGNLSQGNRFKFIERSGEIEAYRGIKVDDGIVRIEYWTEKVQPVINVPIVNYYPEYKPYPVLPTYPIKHYSYRDLTGQSFQGIDSVNYCANLTEPSASGRNVMRSANAFANSSVQGFDSVEEGITVPGSVSDQKFTTVSSFATEPQGEVIILKLRGKVEGKTISHPISVKTKVTCPTCGKRNSANVAFCPGCGTALHII